MGNDQHLRSLQFYGLINDHRSFLLRLPTPEGKLNFPIRSHCSQCFPVMPFAIVLSTWREFRFSRSFQRPTSSFSPILRTHQRSPIISSSASHTGRQVEFPHSIFHNVFQSCLLPSSYQHGENFD